MEGGIYIQEVIIQSKKIIERGSIDICERNNWHEKFQNIHTGPYILIHRKNDRLW